MNDNDHVFILGDISVHDVRTTVGLLKNYNPDDKFAQCLRKDLKYPKNAVIYYIPFDATDFNANIWVPNERIDNPDGSVLASK